MQDYTVRATVYSQRYGQGELVAQLNEEEMIHYAQLTPSQRIDFLKQVDSQFVVEASQLDPGDLQAVSGEAPEASPSTKGEVMPAEDSGQIHSSRRVRMQVNGQDTGWIQVTEDNAAEVQAMVEDFKAKQAAFLVERAPWFGSVFNRPFLQE